MQRGWEEESTRLAPLLPRPLVRALTVALSIGVIAAIFAVALPSIARYGAVWGELQRLRAGWIGVLVAAVVANTATSALPWRVMLPRLGFVSALRITQASTALITVLPGGAPAGMGLSFAMLRRRRIGREAAGLTVALTGVWSQLSTFLFPVVGVAALWAGERLPRAAVGAAIAGIVLIAVSLVLFGVALGARKPAILIGLGVRALAAALLRLARRPPPAWSVAGFLRLRKSTLRAMREHGLALTLATLANQLTSFLIFDLSLRALGIGTSEISVAESFTAWSLARLIESLPLTPGGLGLVELGLTGTLIAFGAPHASLVAAVLLYRSLVIVPTLVFGGLAGLTWKLRWST